MHIEALRGMDVVCCIGCVICLLHEIILILRGSELWDFFFF